MALTDRIAHVLGVSSEEIDFLGRLDSDTLRALHSQIVELLFDPAQSRMGGLQNAAKILPPPVTAKVAEKALGPVLAGRIAGSLDTGSSVAIARRLPPEFLADVAGHVHPQRVEVLVRDLPSRQLDAAADVLIERHDLLALGHFAGIIRPDTLQSIVSRLDASVILDVVPYIEPAARVDDLIELVENPVLLSVLRTAHDNTRWVDAFRSGRPVEPVLSRTTGGRVERARVRVDRWSGESGSRMGPLACAVVLRISCLGSSGQALEGHRLLRGP
ncbi:MAG: hypothetical protein V9F03_09780 [Microthrixaceae bacterium]